MRRHVYLFAAALGAVTSTPVLSSELTIGDSNYIVYEDTYAAAPDAAYGETGMSVGNIVYVDEGTAIQPDIFAVPDDATSYGTNTVEEIYSIDGMESAEGDVIMTETIDGIVYETVASPAQTY